MQEFPFCLHRFYIVTFRVLDLIRTHIATEEQGRQFEYTCARRFYTMPIQSMKFKIRFSLSVVLRIIATAQVFAANRFDIPNSLHIGPVREEYRAGSSIDDGLKIFPRPNATTYGRLVHHRSKGT